MPKTDKRAQAEAKLSPELRPMFDKLIEDYKESAASHTGQVWVNYNILAELIRAGWRKDPH